MLVSAGFDAHVDDPLAESASPTDGFRELSRRCAAIAPRGRGRARGRLRARDAARASSRRHSTGFDVAETAKRPLPGPFRCRSSANLPEGKLACPKDRRSGRRLVPPRLVNGIPHRGGYRDGAAQAARATARLSSASRREDTPSLRSRLFTCERTVCSEMKRRFAISSVPRWSSRRSRTSTSRAESAPAIASGTPEPRPLPSADLVEQPAGDRAREGGLAVRDAVEEGGDLLGRLGLQEIAGGAGADRLQEVLLGAGGGQDDDLALGGGLAQPGERRQAVETGHGEVEQDEIRPEPLGLDDRLARRRRRSRRHRSRGRRAATRAPRGSAGGHRR